MTSVVDYIQSIRESYPQITATSATLNHRGQNSDVLIVNQEWVFRFPKYDHVLEKLRMEVTLLRVLQNRLPLAIPAPDFVSLENKPLGQTFMGYQLINGEPLWREKFREIQDEEILDRLASQLAGFLIALHNFPVPDHLYNKLSRMDTRQEWLDIYERIKQKLFGYMRLDARRQTRLHFDCYLDNPVNFAYLPVLKHSDFGTSNILYDASHERISGVIDFSSAGLGDPAYDFAGLLSSYGEGFIERCKVHYPGLTAILPRVRFYQGTFALYEALFGIENNDQAAFESGIAPYI